MEQEIKYRLEKICNGKVPNGYKKIDNSIFPEEWNFKKLSKIVDFYNGKAHEKDVDESGEYIIVNSKFISTNGKVQKNTNKQIFPLYKGDIVMVMSDVPNGKAIAKTLLIQEDNKYTLNQRICCLRNPSCNINYLNYVIDRNSYYLKFDDGVSQTNLRKDQVLGITVPLPHPPEQQKIASIISTWDKAIELKENLIEEKKKQKKGLMQKLLTGELRLPGFDGEWKEVELKQIFERVSRKNTNGNKNVLTISAQRGLINQEDYFNKSVASTILDNYYLLLKGEFAYNKSYSKGYPMGAIKRLNDYDSGVVTTLYICFALKNEAETSSNFFEQYFESGLLNQGLTQIAQEGGRAHGLLNVPIQDFFNLLLAIPSYDEQNSIADILTTADEEISLLVQELEDLKLQKKGLMQLLFTGIVRVNTEN